MESATAPRLLTIALVGNPNTGKSTLFQALSGIHQRTGNYPGVTVEKKVGRFRHAGYEIDLIDLPGTYSLAPRSLDEMVCVDVLLGRSEGSQVPDVIVCIVDATNLNRNLYLVSQVLELGPPVVIALNMGDLADQRGIRISVEVLSERLGQPVVAIQAHRRKGLDALRRELVAAAGRSEGVATQAAEVEATRSAGPMPLSIRREVAQMVEWLQRNGASAPTFLVERLLLDQGDFLVKAAPFAGIEGLSAELRSARNRIEAEGGALVAAEAIARYGWIREVLKGVVSQPPHRVQTWSDRLDRLTTHRVWGGMILLGVLFCLFQALFSWSAPVMGAMESLFGWLGNGVTAALPAGPFRSLLVDGVIMGVGGVLVFLPQILLLFLFIAVLEDVGYMARAAFLMDRLMSLVGLNGKSFIPLLSSFACAVPGIMSTRVIEHRRDRLLTILIAPLMSCSARLPVYTLLIETFVPDRRWFHGWVGLRGLTMLGCYSVGLLTAMGVGWILRRTILRGERPAFILELPSFKFPSPRVVLARVIDRGWAFVARAGTLILSVSVLVWGAAYFPHGPDVEARVRQTHPDPATLQDEIAGAYLRQSYLGRMGHVIEPVVRPLGWDWRIGSAVIASFPAREVVIGAMGVLYNLGSDEESGALGLRERLRTVTFEGTDQPVYNLPVALSLLVFFALCAQCVATLVVMGRETGGWGWPMFAFMYMTGLAYLGALIVYQGMMAWGFGT